MIKNYTVYFLFLLLSTSVFGQKVGINTQTPRKTLEVAGDMVVTQQTVISELPPIADGDEASFLIQNDSDFIIKLDPKNPSGAALGYIQTYIIENPNLDWVRDFDTGISATDYELIVASAHFNNQLVLVGIEQDKFSLPYTSTFIENDTWHIIADYPGVANDFDIADSKWEIQTLIFSKDLTKQFGVISVPMGGGTTNAAAIPFID